MQNNNFVKYCLENGGNIAPLLFPSDEQKGDTIANPSIFQHSNGKCYINLRNTNYFLYHSEKNIFNQYWGPLQYIHPEDDVSLTTWNYLAEFNPDTLEISNVQYIDTSDLDKKPLLAFIGLEDVRLVEWEGKFYCSGVRRDTTTNGQGRIELSEIEFQKDGIKEIKRYRIPSPENDNSYCEKNWMPIIDKPFHYIKWSNPTQVVKVSLEKEDSVSCETIHLNKDSYLDGYADFRGGSQIIPYKNGYIGLVHETFLFRSELDRKNAEYKHRFLYWDNNFNLINISPSFHFMDGMIEFAAGLSIINDFCFVTFAFQDNASFVLKFPVQIIDDFFNKKEIKTSKKIQYETPLEKFIQNPENPYANFDLAEFYKSLNHFGPASSFFLRAAERTTNEELQYIALIQFALSFESQKNKKRYLTIKTIYQRAICLFPKRPEAYYFLSKLEENHGNYHDGYLYASIGHTFSDEKTHIIKEYPYPYGNLFEKGVCSWWIGNTEEARSIFLNLKLHYQINNPVFQNLVDLNHNNIQYPKREIKYEKSFLSDLKYYFPGVEKIQQNYSQTMQDFFVLTLLNGKKNGLYLEIGSDDPFKNNNTALLEEKYNWKGVSIDINEEMVKLFNEKRPNKNVCLCENALLIDYKKFYYKYFKGQHIIDYLQIDCDPPHVSFEVLKKIILETTMKFKIITFEHDHYVDHQNIREQSRIFLEKQGYTLLVNDVSFDDYNSFEDWWVLKSEIQTENFFRFFNTNHYNNSINNPKKLFFNQSFNK
jgi:tetratricopeptide (TPR) repeat protein